MQHFDDYQTFTNSIAIYDTNQGIGYTALGLVGEVGEYADKIEAIADYSNKTKHYKRHPNDEEWESKNETLLELTSILKQAKEVGAKAEKLKKEIRSGTKFLPPIVLYSAEERDEVAKELGDVLWYVAQAAKMIKMTLSAIVSLNVKKLIRRNKKGLIHGNGDNR